MVPKCADPNELVTALCYFVSFTLIQGKVDVEGNERQDNLLKKIKNCLKLYLSFECWVNEPHPRSQVKQSSKALGILINLIKECFPRDEGWGWNLPKMHAFAKMPHNMLKFGSANNFSGNIGEWALKEIVKDHSEKTQRRPDRMV